MNETFGYSLSITPFPKVSDTTRSMSEAAETNRGSSPIVGSCLTLE